MIFPPNLLSGMRPLCPLKSWIEPTSRPLSHTNSGVTKFTLAPLSMKQVISTPSMTAVPRLALLSHRFLVSSFQNAEGVNCGLASFQPWLYWPWPFPCGGGQAPLVLTPPSQFNACFLWLALSFASFKDSFSGSLHSAYRWPSFPQLKQRPHLSASLTVLMMAT